jgi:hypothetical protein
VWVFTRASVLVGWFSVLVDSGVCWCSSGNMAVSLNNLHSDTAARGSYIFVSGVQYTALSHFVFFFMVCSEPAKITGKFGLWPIEKNLRTSKTDNKIKIQVLCYVTPCDWLIVTKVSKGHNFLIFMLKKFKKWTAWQCQSPQPKQETISVRKNPCYS